jgi:hypothetical protein
MWGSILVDPHASGVLLCVFQNWLARSNREHFSSAHKRGIKKSAGLITVEK